MLDVGVSVGVISLLKEVVSHIKSKKEHDPELLAKLIDLQTAMYDLIEQNAELKGKISELEEQKELKVGLSFNSNWGVWSDDAQEVLFYCTKCLAEGCRVPLQVYSHGFKCGKCNGWYAKPEVAERVVANQKPYDPLGNW